MKKLLSDMTIKIQFYSDGTWAIRGLLAKENDTPQPAKDNLNYKAFKKWRKVSRTMEKTFTYGYDA